MIFNNINRRLEFDNTQFLADKYKSDTIKTLEIFKEIANSICVMLKWEYDAPDLHPDGKLTVLDVNMYLNTVD